MSFKKDAQIDVGQLIVANLQREIAVGKVRVEGIAHTNFEFLDLVTRDLLDAKNVGDVIIGSRNIGAKLLKFGVFKNVEIELKADPEVPGVVDIIYHVEESPRIYASTGADFGATDASMNMSVNIRNAFGNAEILSGVSSYGVESGNDLAQVDTLNADKQSSIQLNLKKPVNANPDDNIEVSVHKLHQSHLGLMAYQDIVQGISLFRCFANEKSLYKYGYTGVWRENCKLAPNAPLSVRWDAGHSLKSSILHEFSFDDRDDLVFPVSGAFFRIYQELAGLGGDVNFFKTEAHGSKATSHYKFGLTMSCKAGLLVPLSKSARLGPRINDRFVLGGPNTLRGFRHGSIGPRDGGAFIGGDIYHALGLDFSFPLPALPSDYIRGHAFFNCGTLLRINQNQIIESCFNLFTTIPSTSIGAGLIARFAGFRLELNYCLPILATSTDIPKPGFQLGIGINFL